MNSSIIIRLPIYTTATDEEIRQHNARVERIWITEGSNCRPIPTITPSTVPAAEKSRVAAAEHGGPVLEAHP